MVRTMADEPRRDRLYTAIVLAFLIGLVALGLLGVPAGLVAVIGIAVAGAGIAVNHRFFAAGRAMPTRRPHPRRSVPRQYVPSVLESRSTKRRGIHLRRHRHASPPLRFR